MNQRLEHAVKGCMDNWGQFYVPVYSGISFNGKAITGYIDEKNYVQIAKTEDGKWMVKKGVLGRGRDFEEVLLKSDNAEEVVDEFAKYIV